MNVLIAQAFRNLDQSGWTGLFLDAWLKSLAVLAAAWILCWCFRRAAAATRHFIWLLAVISLPVLVLLSLGPREWQRPLWMITTADRPGNEVALELSLMQGTTADPQINGPADVRPVLPAKPLAPETSSFGLRVGKRWLPGVFAVWLAGALLGGSSLLAAQELRRRFARKARPLQTAEWTADLAAACEVLHLRRPVTLLVSADDLIPLTWGSWRPVILLPRAAADWQPDRRRVVLLHELAHIKRWDCLTQTVAETVRALYWPNPLAWLATRSMRVEREAACDDLVLAGGHRPSEYATHLVEIARACRCAFPAAAVALARSSQLQARVAAIIDGSRRKKPRLVLPGLLLLVVAFAVAIGGASQQKPSRGVAEIAAARSRQIAQLKSFSEVKHEQAEELARKNGEVVSADFQQFFAAAIRGDGEMVTNRYEHFQLHHDQYARHEVREDLRTSYWQPVLEIGLAYDHVLKSDPKYTSIFADSVLASVPAGSVYFGGTDPGRGLPTAFCRSHAEADPFFTLTQNALADGSYLDYLRSMYGGKLSLPTTEDLQKCFTEYVADVQRRLKENRLKPGEDVRLEDGRLHVSGQVAVMLINALLAKAIFDRNPDRQFFVEESFPLDWMYPCLEPHGLILKLNRQPLTRLPPESIAADEAHWRKLTADMLGGWLRRETPVRETVDFVERVYVHHDLAGFAGDRRFIENDCARRIFSKLRSSIAGLYAWRLGPGAPAQFRPHSEAEQQHLLAQADFAFRQAFVLCPDSPEVTSRYVHLLTQANRIDDALLIAGAALKVDPQNTQVHDLLDGLKRKAPNRGEHSNKPEPQLSR